MDPSQRNQRARTFARLADVYARTRPGYPVDAVRWLVAERSARVLELGAGSGQLTAVLLAEQHRVTATDPAYPMLAKLRKQHAGVRVVQSGAEQIPVHAGAVDVVVAAQAFHWFDHERALPEIARVLRPGGVLALLWNIRDESVPWVRRLSRIIRAEGDNCDTVAEALEESGHFDDVETKTFRHWQQVDRESLLGLVASRSYVAELDERERAAVLEQVGALYDDYGRGHDGMLLPYLTHCFRAHVVSAPQPPLDDGLLIDFT